MLSVKHIEISNHETILPAVRVSCQPGSHEGPAPMIVFVEDERGNVRDIRDGTVYVMNDAGKTVAKYFIPTSMLADGPYAQKMQGVTVS
jgi:hypothetical protein